MPQSILVRNIETYRKDFENQILSSAKNRLWGKRFGIGQKTDYNKDNHALLYFDIFNTNNCDLIDYINKSMEGKEVCEEKVTSEGILPLMQSSTKYTPCEVVSDACAWEEIEW